MSNSYYLSAPFEQFLLLERVDHLSEINHLNGINRLSGINHLSGPYFFLKKNILKHFKSKNDTEPLIPQIGLICHKLNLLDTPVTSQLDEQPLIFNEEQVTI